ncbi:MAG: hypothetical protein JKY89_05075 [Immundisolibacteraceae bacterium]|nr:hypothetical protein [Immundisolibacteraceae bacterium]
MNRYGIEALHRVIKWIGLVVVLMLPGQIFAASAEEIEIRVEGSLNRFAEEVVGGDVFLKKAHGVLVFPKVIKAGFGIGGEYGEGALQVKGKTVEYYSTAAASIGFQFGAQSKTVVLVFLTEQGLIDFRNNEEWKAGVDGSVALVEWGAGEDINTTNIKDPIVGFVFSNKGLMFNLTLEGSKFTKLKR